jgi:translation initiation factor 5A
MELKFVRGNSLKEGGYVLIDDEVCRIKEVEKSKSGKHGAGKLRITGVGVFDNQKRTLLSPASNDISVPIITRSNAHVVAVMGSVVQIIDDETFNTLDTIKPSDIKDLRSGDEVEYISVDEKTRIIRKK